VISSDHKSAARAPRKNLFLAAVIRSDSLSAPVRIRNLSETGGLIEAPNLPAVGESLTLIRQEVEIGAQVAWREGDRCGIQFAGSIVVDDWIAGKSLGPATRAPQVRVDDIQRTIRAGGALVDASESTLPAVHVRNGLDRRIAHELDYVVRLLNSVATGLADDPVLVRRHATSLQNFDVACQIIGHLRTVLEAHDKAAAIDGIAIAELQARLKGRALF
jgi:hypothetical protein